MTMRVTMTTTVMGEAGSLLTSGSIYTVSDAFGQSLIGLKRATDTDLVLSQAPTATGTTALTDTTASRVLSPADVDTVVRATSGSAIALTVPDDTVFNSTAAITIAVFQGGAGAVTFAAGSGVTLRGTAPVTAQYAIYAIMRVGANEWAYL